MHLLDERGEQRDAGLVALARHSATMSPKEMLLKACEALSWYHGPAGAAYLLERIEEALRQLADSGTRTVQRFDEALEAVTRCLCQDDHDDSSDDDDDSGSGAKRDVSSLYEPALRIVELASRHTDDWHKVCEPLLQVVSRRGHEMGAEPLAKCARLLAARL